MVGAHPNIAIGCFAKVVDVVGGEGRKTSCLPPISGKADAVVAVKAIARTHPHKTPAVLKKTVDQITAEPVFGGELVKIEVAHAGLGPCAAHAHEEQQPHSRMDIFFHRKKIRLLVEPWIASLGDG